MIDSTPEVTESTAPAAVTADMVLQMLAMTEYTGVISIDGDEDTPASHSARRAVVLRVEGAPAAFAACREAVSERTTALAWNGHRPFTRADASRYAAYLTTIL